MTHIHIQVYTFSVEKTSGCTVCRDIHVFPNIQKAESSSANIYRCTTYEYIYISASVLVLSSHAYMQVQQSTTTATAASVCCESLLLQDASTMKRKLNSSAHTDFNDVAAV